MLNSSRLIRSPRKWQLVLAGYWLGLFVATHLPSNAPLLTSDRSDKPLHFTAYAALAALMATVLQLAIGRLTLRHLSWAWVALVLYGAVDEWTQIPVGRDASVGDWLTDAIGSAVGLAVFHLWNRKGRNRNPVGPGMEVESYTCRSPWRKFSLKSLFVLVAVVAAICYWLVQPSLTAQRFAAAITSGDYATANNLFQVGTEAFPGSRQDQRYTLQIDPLTMQDILKRERRITVAAQYGDKGGIATYTAIIRAEGNRLKLEAMLP